MARKLTGTPKKREMEVQGTQMTEAALKKRSQGIWIRRISAMMSALLACALFYVLMKPAITMENGKGSGNMPQLVCMVPEHVHSEQCWGYDHPESEPVYGLSRDLECSFVPHVHDISCYDEAGELICGISERYIHVHDDLCYDQGNLVCLLEESPWNPEKEAVQERVLVCDLPESAGHVHTDACYTVTYLTDEEPVCGLKEGGHVHTEDCYGPVLICEEEHEHTEDCYAEGLVCHLEEGSEHVHTLSCYPSIRELTCGLEETEGHVHDEDCYAILTVEKEPHVHTEACYEDDRLICGELEIRSHQHTKACWHETQVMLSGGHVHNSECGKVLLCGMQEHVHTRDCYSGPEAEIQLLLAENSDTEKNVESGEDADAILQETLLEEEEQLLTEDMDAAVSGVQLEDGEAVSSDETKALQEEDGVLLSEEEELFSEWELVNEDPEWEDVQWDEEPVEVASDDGLETPASQEVSEDSTEPEIFVADAVHETPASEEISEYPTEKENLEADDTAGSRFEEAYYLQDVETLEDGVFAVHLHEDEGVYIRTILEKAGVEAEQVDVTSDIPFLDIREDSFVCRFAFTEGSVVIRAGGEELTVKCTYAGPWTETENIAETGEAESSAETAADGVDNRVNAEVENVEDSAEGTVAEPSEKEAVGNFHTEETAVDGQEDGTQTEGAAGEVPAGETDAEHLDGDAAGEDSAEQTAADGQADGTQAEDAARDNLAEDTDAEHVDGDAAGEDSAEDNAADGQENRKESENGNEETSSGAADAESKGNEAAGENGTVASLTFVRGLEKVEDGVYSVRLSMGSAVRLGDIPELEGIAPEEIIISSEIEDLETGTDYFACRKAFEQGKVILTSGDIRVTVQCTYVPAAGEDEAGENDTAVDGTGDAANGETGDADADNGENAGEDADAADETGNADVSGEQGQDAAEPEIQDMARVLLNGEETDLLRLEENPENAEAVLDMLHTYLALEASESQEIGLEEDAAAAKSDPAEGDEETRLTYTHVFRMEAEETFEGVAAISMPVHARFSDLLPDGTYLTSVNCQLFHIDLDHGEILPVQNFEVEISDEEIVSIAFETERTGTWVLLYTLDYAFEERAAVLTLDFSDFDALMLEDTEETGISVIEAEPEMNEEPAPGRRLLAKGRNNGKKKEENSSGFGGISIDLARLLEAVYAQNGAEEGEFQGIRMLMENLAGAEVLLETFVQEMSEGGVTCDGMSLQILDNGSILLRGKHMTLTIRIQGFAREEQEIYVYTFGEQKTVSMSEIFQASGMPEQFVPARFAYEVSDDTLVTLTRDGNDWLVTASGSFDEVTLYVHRGWYSGVILLRNPGNVVEPGTEIRSADGTASIVLNEEAVLPDGTELTVQPSEGMDIQLLLDQDFGENADMQVKWFDISLGDVHEIQAVVTLHGVIDVPEFAKKRGNVQARVYHAGSNGLEVLDAEVHGTDICFVTNGFSEFAVAYTVDFHWEMNGETYEFTLPGGGAVSLTRLLSALGFQEMLASDDLENTVQTDDGSIEAETAADSEVLVIHEESGESAGTSEEAAGTKTDNGSDRSLLAFAEQIQSVSFSDPLLVWTGKAETDTTIGQMKVDYGIACLLSSDMTADMLEEANNMQIAAGDWALISLMPFTSEESLTVTMKNGDVFVIRVTDAQIRKTVISASGEAYEITVTFDDDAGIPETSDLVVREIMEGDPEYDAYYAAASEHVNASDTESDTAAAEDESQETNGSGNARRDIAQARFFDIEIWNDGSKIAPLKPVSVEIRLVDSAELADAVPEVLHFAKSGLESMDYTDRSADEDVRVFAFEADGFSVYSVIYTVDFHYEIDGKTYEFQLPGGGFLSLEHLVEGLGLAETGDNADGNASVEAEEDAAGTGTEEENAESQKESEARDDEASDAFEATMRLNHLPVSDAAKQFTADVANVEFSSPELVWVGKADNGTTVGQLKEEHGLEIQYSADLTDEQIGEINGQTVEAEDWALVSLKPFTSEETLTITMKNGDAFAIQVLDAQISTHVITADGEDFLITVTYGPESGIPAGATLDAEEILEGTDEYEDMIQQSKTVLSQEKDHEIEILFSRFFDISILDADGNEVEPLSTVYVTVQYDVPINIADAKPSVVHFADNGIEVIQPKTCLAGNGKENTINVFEYEQESFSGIGTIIETDSLEDGQYFIVVGDNGSYYAMKNDGSLAPVTYYHQTKQVEAAPGINENDLLWNVNGVGSGYYMFKAVNGENYLSLQNGAVVNSSLASVLVQHDSWDESHNETGGYYLYHTPNSWDSNSWNPLRLGYWDNERHFYVGDGGSSPQRIRLYKYAVSSTSGEPPVTNIYTGIEVNPTELDEWLMSLFDDMPVGYDGYHKTAEVYDYENRIYQIDFTALSNAQGFASDIDIAFSVDMSNSMLFPSTMTSIGAIELRQSVLEATLEKDQVYFVISDVKGTATVNALFYDEGGRGEWYNGQYYTVPAGWRYEDASKYARGQRKSAHETDSGANLDKYVGDNTGFKIQGTDTGFYTLFKVDEGYLNYIISGQSVYENPYNRLSDMKDSLRMAFNFLDIMAEKYHARIRIGWNGFAKDVVDGSNYDYRCAINNHGLKDLSQVDYRTILSGITQAGNQTGGGTRPDKAFEDAANMGWASNTQKYLILITDGAPQGGGASSASAALSMGQNAGRKLTQDYGVNIISIGLSTEHVDGAHNLFEYISCQDPNPNSNQKMIYQAKDGDALKNAVVDALRILVQKAVTVGTIKDTIDPVFYPVSTDGTPLTSGDKIDLSGKLTTNTSKPYGVIGWDGQNWTVEWKDQDIIWADEEHPYGWHGRVLVKAKENFLGGNDISTNKGQAALDVKNAKILNSNGTWSNIPFSTLMDLSSDQLATRYMDTPHVNVDELEMTKNDTEWTVYLNTEVDPGEQMKALFNEIKVMKVVTDGAHEMIVHAGETAKDTMVYDLVPTEDGHYSYEEASSDVRNKRAVNQAFFYLKDLFSMKDSLNNDFIIDSMTADEAIEKLLAGEKVEVKYQGYGHGTADRPVGTIILELKADPGAQVNNLETHNAGPAGNAVEKYILSAEYKPTESTLGSWYWNTGSFGTKDKGKEAEDKTKYNTHVINVIKRILTIRKTDVSGTMISGADAGEATFEIYQKDSSGGKVNVTTVTTSGGVYTWDPVPPAEDQKKPGDYWADSTTYYIRETVPPKGYAGFDGEITVTLDISDTASDVPNLGDNEKVPYNWTQTASLSTGGDADYVSAEGNPDITVTVKNDKSVDIVVIKTDTNGTEIPGAKFSLTKGAVLQTDLTVIRKGGSVENEEDHIAVENGVFTIPAGGVTVLGLGAGEYTLTETSAPDGYIKTMQPVRFTAGRDGTVTYTNPADNPAPKVTSDNGNTQYTIQNEPGVALPSTGGPGTLFVYMLGVMITALAGILLARKSRGCHQ